MSEHKSARPRVLMVCSRPIPALPESGREKTLLLIHRSLCDGGDVEVFIMKSLLEEFSWWQFLKIVARWLGGLLIGHPLPLQSLLFWNSKSLVLLRRKIDECVPDTLYFDGVRTGLYLEPLRKFHPALRMVCDFDDLMSRRMAHLAEERLPISLGYLGKYVPGWINRRVITPLAAGVIPRYEARALSLVEQAILTHAQAVVLVSGQEADLLRSASSAPAQVVVIPPAAPPASAVLPQAGIERFVFIGSDSLLQNRKSLDYLAALWQRVQPRSTLHVYGRQKGSYEATAGIVVHGFVADVAQAYTPGSVLLAPSFISGGVKTKVLEAMSHGIVVVGTSITFEGIDAPIADLILDDTAMVGLVTSPGQWAPRLAQAGLEAVVKARLNHAPQTLARRWRAAVWPDQTAG